MRKFRIFLSITLVVLAVFACTMPEKFEIRGTPSLRFAANVDIVELFSDRIEEALDFEDSQKAEYKIIRCKKPETHTLLIHLLLFENTNFTENIADTIPGFQNIGSLPGDASHTPDVDITLQTNNVVAMHFDELKEKMDGFEFKEVKAKLYMSGSDIANSLNINLSNDNDRYESRNRVNFNETASKMNVESGIDEEKWAEELEELPHGENEIDLTELVNDAMSTGGALEFDYTVFLAKGTPITKSLATGARTKAELIIWLPLEFHAGASGGSVNLPDDFMGNGNKDLFGREASNNDGKSFTDMLEGLSIKIEMNNSPFKGGNLTVKSGSILLPSTPLTGNSLDLKIDEESMAKVNEPANIPFVPEFIISFTPGGNLRIPRDLAMTAVSLEAKIKYIIGE